MHLQKSRLIAILLSLCFIIAIGFAAFPVLPDSGAVQALLRGVAGNYLLFTGALAVLSTLSMAVLQTIKDLVPVLRWYQQVKTRHWLHRKAAEAAKVESVTQPRTVVQERLAPKTFLARVAPELHYAFTFVPDEANQQTASQAEADLLRLATAGDRAAFYDLPIEQVCGQMNVAAQVVLDYPARYPGLLKCLASLSSPEDREAVSSTEFAMLREKGGLRTADEERRFKEVSQLVMDARSRVNNQIHRSIDAFQISVGYRWKWYLQIASFLISFVITVVAVNLGALSGWVSDGSIPQHWAAIVAIGLVGGFLAPVVRDIQAITQQLRK
jgi:fluoride ion exporter CrcB/FEX